MKIIDTMAPALMVMGGPEWFQFLRVCSGDIQGWVVIKFNILNLSASRCRLLLDTILFRFTP